MEDFNFETLQSMCIRTVDIYFTLGAVSAQELNQTDQISIDGKDTDVILEQNDKTFTDLNNTITTSDSTVNIDFDYTFNQTADKNGVAITAKNLVINGNGHYIDANSQSRIFTINASNITINNLILKNANNSAIFITGSFLTTNNVTFENNFNDNGGAVHGENTTFKSVNDRFTDNDAKRFGSAILLQENSTFYLCNGSFKSQKELCWGLIDLTKCNFTIVNTTFNDIKSKYSSALHIERSEGLIKNCNFINLHASITAGAIGFADIAKSVTIDNCTFKNATSTKNAGAVIFISGEADPFLNESRSAINGGCIIKNSQFIECYSELGGAVMHLEGILNIENCNFTNNSALYMGAGIYLSHANATLDNTYFNENRVFHITDKYNSGGAIFSDRCNLTVKSSNFTENFAISGSAVSLYESNYNISNSNFNGTFTYYIYSVFDGKTAIIDKTNNFVDAKNEINLTDYVYVLEGWGKQVDYNPIILDEKLVNETYFNLVDYGLVTPVRNQGWSGSCWAFGSAAALESAFLKATNKTTVLDISENNIKGTGLKYYFYGIDLAEGASHDIGASNFIGWLGFVEIEDDAYDELGRVSTAFLNKEKYHIYDYVGLPKYKQSTIEDYKMALIKYGALAVTVHGADGGKSGDYNDKTYGAYYIHDGSFTLPDHAVTLVGWNDSYSKDNFNTPAPHDGAWIIKNSWGTEWGDHGYYYVSYYDDFFAGTRSFGAIGYIVNNNHNYEKVYEYDINSAVIFFTGKLKGNLTQEEETKLFDENYTKYKEYMNSIKAPTVSYANIFEAIDDDLIAAVGTYFNQSDVDYRISISVNDKVVYTQSGKSSRMGYETIKLNSYVSIKKGDIFIINMTSNQVPISDSRLKVKEGMSLSNKDAEKWQSPTHPDGTVVCIKAYTIPKSSITLKANNVNVIYANNAKVTVNVVSNGAIIVGETVKVTFNGKTYTGVTDKNGNAVLTIPAKVLPKTYNVKVTSADKSTTFKITVKKATPKITAKKKTFKKSKKVKKYSMTLKDNKGKAMKKVKVYLKVKGKTYAAKTSAKGKAVFNLKKLTKKGTFKAKITYKGNKYFKKVTKTVKIKIK